MGRGQGAEDWRRERMTFYQTKFRASRLKEGGKQEGKGGRKIRKKERQERTTFHQRR